MFHLWIYDKMGVSIFLISSNGMNFIIFNWLNVYRLSKSGNLKEIINSNAYLFIKMLYNSIQLVIFRSLFHTQA